MSGGRTTLSATSKKDKKKHLRTYPSPNRSTSSEKFDRGTPTGMSSPIVLVWDHAGNLLLDLVLSSNGFYDIALVNFTYEFKEKEEDKCTIVMASNKLEMMNNLKFFKGQKLSVSWGYMDGNLRPPLRVVVVDTKEKYDDQGFNFTLVCSDNLSFLGRGKSSLLVRLETSTAAIKGLLTDNSKDLENDISQLRGWKVWDYGATTKFGFINGKAYWESIKSTDKFPQTTQGQASNYMKELTDYYSRTFQAKGMGQPHLDSLPSHHPDDQEVKGTFRSLLTVYDVPPDDLKQAVANGELASTGQFGVPLIDKGIPGGPTSNDPPPIPESTPKLSPEDMQLFALVPWVLRGYHIPITGKNVQGVAQHALDKCSPYPMQVTGRDGKMITYNKDRAINSTPIRSYTFKGETGRLLDFTYDTNSKYSDDKNILVNFAVDPKTGAITRKDFINDPKKKDEWKDTQTPTQQKQILFDDEVFKTLDDLALNNPEEFQKVARQPQFQKYTSKDPITGNIVLVATDHEEALSYGNMELARGDAQEHVMAVDNAHYLTPRVSCPTPHLNETAEAVENEIKNLRRGEQEQVKAHATVLGDPQITSGVRVLMAGLATRRNGAYFLTGCIHEIQPGQGYKTKFEMYATAEISQAVNTLESTTEKGDIATKAKEIKGKKIKVFSNWDEIQARGYFLKSDYIKEDWDIKASKIDRDWDVKMPGTFYRLRFTRRDGQVFTYQIKVPITTGGYTQDPLKAFGYDAIYDMLGCHDELWVRMNLKLGYLEESEVKGAARMAGDAGETPQQNYDPAPIIWSKW